MRKLVLLFALLSLSAFAEGPQDWYTPPTFINDKLKATFDYGYEQYGITVTANGIIVWAGMNDNGFFEPNLDPAMKFAIEYAMTAKLTALRNEEKIKRLGETLTSVFMTQGFKTEFNGTTYTLKIPKNALTEAAKKQEAIQLEGNKLWDDLSGKVDEQTITRVDKKLTLKNKPLSKASVAKMENGILKWEDLDPYLVISNDLKSLDTNKQGEWEIKGWSTAKACGADLTKMLTDPNDNNRGQHLILTKAGDALHYLPIGDTINTNSTPVLVDEKSITKITETSEDGKETTKMALMGFKDAGGTKDSPAIPYSGDGDNLLWQSFLTFFNPNMFESKNGKINLKGLDADEKEVRILTVKAGSNGAAVTSDSMKTFIDPPLEWLNNKITVTGYKEAKEGEYLCRSASGVTWKKVDDSIYADEKSITTNSTPKAFALAGFADAEENDIPFRDSSKLNWKPLTDFLDTTVDNKSIRLNDKDDLEVAGASNVTSPRKYFGSSTTTSQIGWYDLPNVTTNRVDVDEITLTTDNTADGKVKTIRWKSTPPSAPSLAKMGAGVIEWIPFNDITNNNAIVGVDDISVATNGNGKLEIKGWSTQAACGADLIKMLTDADDSDRKNHQLLCRVNNSIHYLPFDKVLDLPKVDGDTLVEKGDGTIGLAGSYGAEEGTVPHRTANGLEWKKAGTPDIKADEPLSLEEQSDGSLKLKINEDVLCKCEPHNRPVADETTIFENEDGVWSVGENYLDAEGVTNAVNAAVSNGVCKVDGITIIKDDNTGEIAVNQGVIPTFDGDTIIEKGDGTIGLANSYNAPEESVPTRSGDGLTWVEPTEVTFVVDVIWDEQTKSIKKKTATYKIYGTLLTEDEDYQ